MVRVEVAVAAHQTFPVTLGEQAVTVGLWWAPLPGAWYLDLAFATGKVITNARQVSVHARLLREAGRQQGFRGDLVAVAADFSLRNLDRSSRFFLFYLTEDEVGSGRWR